MRPEEVQGSQNNQNPPSGPQLALRRVILPGPGLPRVGEPGLIPSSGCRQEPCFVNFAQLRHLCYFCGKWSRRKRQFLTRRQEPKNDHNRHFCHFCQLPPRIRASNKHYVPSQRVVARKNIRVCTAEVFLTFAQNDGIAGRQNLVKGLFPELVVGPGLSRVVQKE